MLCKRSYCYQRGQTDSCTACFFDHRSVFFCVCVCGFFFCVLADILYVSREISRQWRDQNLEWPQT